MISLRFIVPIAAFSFLVKAEVPTRGIDVELISEANSIQPGRPFQVALSIHHHEGFHTYWRNPGIVGVATSIDWALPDGFTAGTIQWPLPEQIDMSGHPAHGYERDVLLMVCITPPKTLTKPAYTISGTASWMACAAACHPGSKRFSITLPVEVDADKTSVHRPRFDAAKAELPHRLPGWSGTWLSGEDGTQITLQITPPTDESQIQSAYFFSSDGQISSDQPQTLRRRSDGKLLLNATRSEFGPGPKNELPGLLQITRTNGTRLIGFVPLKLVEKTPKPTP